MVVNEALVYKLLKRDYVRYIIASLGIARWPKLLICPKKAETKAGY